MAAQHNTPNKDCSADLQQQVQQAIQQGKPLNICGSGSKNFLGRSTQGERLSLSEHRGIIEYDPRELVLTARAGTPLAEIETALADAGQMLTFEPPHFGAAATLGGTIACGLSGPRRPYAGSARDAVLGCKIINGKGEILSFGGQVMKNVAGYDVSRLMAGAYGTLGVLLEISLKVLPRPAASLTLMHEHSTAEAIRYMSQLLSQPMPVDAACHHNGLTYIRIAGSEQAVKHAQKQMGGEPVNDAATFWLSVREQQHAFFSSSKPLYRVMLKPTTPALNINGEWLLDWGGAQRWLLSDEPLAVIRERVNTAGGHVSSYRNHAQGGELFSPLPGPLFEIHQRLKLSFDPHRIFNPERTYSGL